MEVCENKSDFCFKLLASKEYNPKKPVKLFLTTLLSAIFFYIATAAPQITCFNKNEYSAAMQNWSVAIDGRGFFYAANNQGLLEYDGSSWLLYPMPNKTIIRSLLITSDNRIYVGSYEEFGYFEEDKFGKKQYFSLSKFVSPSDLHNDEIWRIVQSKDEIFFQAFSKIFIFKLDKQVIVKPKQSFVLLQKARERLFIHETGTGLCELIDHQYRLLPGGEIFKTNEVRMVLPYGEKSFLVGTTLGGLYIYDNQVFTHWNIPLNKQLATSQINNGLFINGKYYLGTIVDGLFIINTDGSIVDHIHSKNGLNNNTILGMCSDKNDNLWLALDRGISFIDFKSPMELYTDKTGETGAVYSAILSDDKLYVGTNQGVLLYKRTSDGRFRRGNFIEGTQGQVWQLISFDEQILCGHTDGTFRIENERAMKISDSHGGFCLRQLPSKQEVLIQSTYGNLTIFRKVGINWAFSKLLQGFSESLPYMEIDHQGGIWANQIFKGTYHIHLNEQTDSITDRIFYGKNKGFSNDYNIKVAKINSRIVFATGDKVYTWDDLNDTILPYTHLNEKLGKFAAAEKIIAALNDQYWFISGDKAALFHIWQENVDFISQVNLSRMGIGFAPQYPNIVPLNDTLSLFCLENGFSIYNSKKSNFKTNPQLLLRSIQLSTDKSSFISMPLENPDKKVIIPYKYNNLNFNVTLVSSSALPPQFSYKVEGLDDQWTPWTNDPFISLKRVQSGNYKLRVKAEDSNGNIAEFTYSFLISPPWYRSNVAYIFYFVFFILMLFVLRQTFLYRLKKHRLIIEMEEQEKRHREQLVAEQRYVKLENEKLDAEILHKNVQLANTTMSLVKKNELLIQLKEELEKQKEELGNRYPNRHYDRMQKLIEKDLTDEDYWKIFETHFDQAHQDFFKRLKVNYPDLTPNDLKLCAYLKLNLSTKEIAPLLNITVRGIEVHRYRLRKRLCLETDQNLVEFLMNF